MTRVKREFRDEKIQRINQNAPESYRNNTHERFYLVYEPQNRSRMLLRDSSPRHFVSLSCFLSSFLSGTAIEWEKKTISTHRNFTRNGRRANHRGLLLLNILLLAQGNLGAGKRGSRDREGHSVRFIIRKFVLVSHPQRKEEVKQTEAKIKLKNGLRKVLLSQQERTKKFKKLQITYPRPL